MGILQGQMWFFYVITLVVIAGIVYYLQKHGQKDKLLGVALALMLGGAIGNFIDRIFRQEVVDFAHFVFGDYHYQSLISQIPLYVWGSFCSLFKCF